MSNNTANVSFRIDAETKNRAEVLFEELGLSMATAFKLFLRQSIRENKIPFEITLDTPNKNTLKAMHEAEEILKNPSSYKGYTNTNELLEDLKK